jgi:hypothetical protein
MFQGRRETGENTEEEIAIYRDALMSGATPAQARS